MGATLAEMKAALDDDLVKSIEKEAKKITSWEQLETVSVELTADPERGRRYEKHFRGERFGVPPAEADRLVNRVRDGRGQVGGAASYTFATPAEQYENAEIRKAYRHRNFEAPPREQIADLRELVREQQKQIEALIGAQK